LKKARWLSWGAYRRTCTNMPKKIFPGKKIFFGSPARHIYGFVVHYQYFKGNDENSHLTDGFVKNLLWDLMLFKL
jgi:hypothetical protein